MGAGLDIPKTLNIKAIGLAVASEVPNVTVEILRVRRKVNAIQAAGRVPSEDEWRIAWEIAKSIHNRVQGG